MQKHAMFEDVRSALRDKLLSAAAGYAQTPDGRGRVAELLRTLEPPDLRAARANPALMSHLPSSQQAFLARLIQEHSPEMKPLVKGYMKDPRNYGNVARHVLNTIKMGLTGEPKKAPVRRPSPLDLSYTMQQLRKGRS